MQYGVGIHNYVGAPVDPETGRLHLDVVRPHHQVWKRIHTAGIGGNRLRDIVALVDYSDPGVHDDCFFRVGNRTRNTASRSAPEAAQGEKQGRKNNRNPQPDLCGLHVHNAVVIAQLDYKQMKPVVNPLSEVCHSIRWPPGTARQAALCLAFILSSAFASSALHLLPKQRNPRDLEGLPIRYAKFMYNEVSKVRNGTRPAIDRKS